MMPSSIDRKKMIFYLWVGLGYLFIGVFYTFHKYPDKFAASLFNNLWGIIYVVVLNFTLFEYAIAYVSRKRRSVIYNILLGILVLWLYLMLYSYGSYAWRLLGIQVHVYTALKDFSTVDQALQNQMGY